MKRNYECNIEIMAKKPHIHLSIYIESMAQRIWDKESDEDIKKY
jgi:hypothetical protein